jgi:phage shock protein PspC (stress-responsive transcriptional regulator)/ribosomal protein L37E
MLIHCPDCFKKISRQSDTCVHCGFPLAKFYREKEADKKEKEKINKLVRDEIKKFNETQLKVEGVSKEEYKKKWGYTPWELEMKKQKVKENPNKYPNFNFNKNYKNQFNKYAEKAKEKAKEKLRRQKEKEREEKKREVASFKHSNWYASRDEKIIWGVCAGIAHKMEKPVSEIRKYFLIGFFFGAPGLYLIFNLLFKQVNTLNDDGEIRRTDF